MTKDIEREEVEGEKRKRETIWSEKGKDWKVLVSQKRGQYKYGCPC